MRPEEQVELSVQKRARDDPAESVPEFLTTAENVTVSPSRTVPDGERVRDCAERSGVPVGAVGVVGVVGVTGVVGVDGVCGREFTEKDTAEQLFDSLPSAITFPTSAHIYKICDPALVESVAASGFETELAGTEPSA